MRTTLSLATTLNMQHLDELISPLNPDSRSFRPLDDLLLGPVVPRQFQALGYRYYPHRVVVRRRPTSTPRPT